MYNVTLNLCYLLQFDKLYLPVKKVCMSLKNQLILTLDKAEGERGIHSYLKKEPLIIWATFMHCGGHSDYVIPEFSLAGKYRTDFVVMQSFSGGWNVAFVELEPVNERLFNKDGSQSARLRSAIKQIDDWKNFVEWERASLCSHLADAAQKNDVLYPERNLGREPRCVTKPLRDPRTFLRFEYYIVMGRRKDIDEESSYAKSRIKPNHNIELATYDRFIQVAENLEQQYLHYKDRNLY